VHLIQKKSYLVEQSKIEGIAEAYNIQILKCLNICFIRILSHTIHDLANDASSSGMTAGVSVFVQKSGALRVTRFSRMHITFFTNNGPVLETF
jgi:hypothetical protein